jgi:hypothetical protein
MTDTNADTTFEEAVKLVGASPAQQERNDLILDYGMLGPIWRWSRDSGLSLEAATEASKKVGRKFMTVRQPVEERPMDEESIENAPGKRTPSIEQKSRRRKPLPARAPASTTIAETNPAPQSRGPTEPPLVVEPAPAESCPGPISDPREILTPDLPTPRSEPAAAETSSTEASPESLPVPLMAPPISQATAEPIAVPSAASQPTPESVPMSGGPVNGMPSSTPEDKEEHQTVRALDETVAPSQTTPRPQRVNVGRSLNRLYLLVLWFVASSGVFAYFLGRITAFGVAWVAGYWMITISVGLLLWAASTLAFPSNEGQSDVTKGAALE